MKKKLFPRPLEIVIGKEIPETNEIIQTLHPICEMKTIRVNTVILVKEIAIQQS